MLRLGVAMNEGNVSNGVGGAAVGERGRALFFLGPRQIELRDIESDAPRAGEVLARAIASGVSQGTELLLYRGEGPAIFDPSLPRDSQAGTYPCRYGYAWVGEIVAAGPSSRHELGTRVFALAPHGELAVLADAAARPLRSSIPPLRGVLAANLETAVTCVWDAASALGDRAVVLGGGVVGALSAWLLDRAGAQVVLVEPSAARRAAASSLAPRVRVVAAGEPDGRADVVLEATGDPHTLDAAIAWCAKEGRVVVASFYGSRRAPIDLGDAFHRRRLELASSQVSSIPPRLAPRWDADRRFELVLDLLEEPALDALLAPPVKFEDADSLYACLDGRIEAPPCHAFVYG